MILGCASVVRSKLQVQLLLAVGLRCTHIGLRANGVVFAGEPVGVGCADVVDHQGRSCEHQNGDFEHSC